MVMDIDHECPLNEAEMTEKNLLKDVITLCEKISGDHSV